MMEFVLRNRPERQVVFKFYPEYSHMHGFGDEPPKTFQEVYKVYYCWGIMEQSAERMTRRFYMDCDECSVLTELSSYIRTALKVHNRLEAVTFGQPGSDWTIQRFFIPDCELEEEQDENELTERDYVDFTVFDNYTNTGYRFTLSVNEAELFANFLDRVNEHMLERSEPI